jgi:hypothetical protein
LAPTLSSSRLSEALAVAGEKPIRRPADDTLPNSAVKTNNSRSTRRIIINKNLKVIHFAAGLSIQQIQG